MSQKRNYGVDLLRIVATYMIVTLHVLAAGGILYTIDSSSPVYETAWFLEFASYCAVNCYALISGYVGLNSKFRVSNILLLWLQVVTTTVVITIGFYFLGADVQLADIKKACTPVTSEIYWYFTAYVCLYFFTPFLNQFVLCLTSKMSKCLLIAFAILFSIVPTIWETDLFLINNGYSVAWLVILYIVGAIIKNHYSEVKIKKRILGIGYVGAVILTLGSKLGIEYLNAKISFSLFASNFLMNYNSPTIVLAGVCLVLLFANINMDKFSKLIAFFAPFTFGIYIIHSHPFVWNKILINRFTYFTNLHPILLVIAVLLTSTLIFTGCSIIEWCRIKIFKLLHLYELCKKLEEKITHSTRNC